VSDEPTTSELERLIERNHRETSADILDLKTQQTANLSTILGQLDRYLLTAIYEANERARAARDEARDKSINDLEAESKAERKRRGGGRHLEQEDLALGDHRRRLRAFDHRDQRRDRGRPREIRRRTLRGIARDAGLGGGVLALGITASLATFWVMGIQQDRDRYQAEAAQPRPTVTRTQTTPGAAHPAPSSTTGAVSASATPAAGSARGPAAQAVSAAGASRPGAGTPSGSAPRPAPQPPPTARDGALVAVRLPLGVLPTVRVHLGGSR
jgi:hypothetical protein